MFLLKLLFSRFWKSREDCGQKIAEKHSPVQVEPVGVSVQIKSLQNRPVVWKRWRSVHKWIVECQLKTSAAICGAILHVLHQRVTSLPPLSTDPHLISEDDGCQFFLEWEGQNSTRPRLCATLQLTPNVRSLTDHWSCVKSPPAVNAKRSSWFPRNLSRGYMWDWGEPHCVCVCVPPSMLTTAPQETSVSVLTFADSM